MNMDSELYRLKVIQAMKKRNHIQAFENANNNIKQNYAYTHSDFEYDYFKNPVADTLEKKYVKVKYKQ